METNDRCNHKNEYKQSISASRYCIFMFYWDMNWFYSKSFIYKEIEQENESLSFQCDLENELKSRIKGQRLTDWEKSKIYAKILTGVPVRDLKKLYQISQSTISRIVKKGEIKNQEENNQTSIKIRAVNNRNLWKVKAMFVKNNKEPFYWKDIKAYLIKTHGILLDINLIRRILKERLGLSFKRCSPRPLSIDYKVLRLKQIPFAVKLWRITKKSTIFINVDESTITRSTKINYSWGWKGIPLNLPTLGIKGSIGLVTAIMSNGVSVTGIRKGTIKSDSFIEFIKHLLVIWKRL